MYCQIIQSPVPRESPVKQMQSSTLKIIIMSALIFFFFLLGLLYLAIGLPTYNADYKEALKMSLLFFEAQRSGKLPADKRIPWRYDSALNDQGFNGENLVGGYYDYNDMVKFGFTMAFATTMVSWGVVAYPDAYKQIGQYKYVLDAIKWATDYFLKCHVSPYEFYAQVGDFKVDHQFWGRPEDMNMSRPAFKIDKDHPGSDVAAETAAAFASASLVFQPVDKEYSKVLLEHSKELFDFATKYQGFYNESFPDASNSYENEEYDDEIAWAAVWLYRTTKERKYRKYAEQFAKENSKTIKNYSFWYNWKLGGVLALLGQETGKKQHVEWIRNYCDHVIHGLQRTPKKLVYLGKQGTLPKAANLAFLCMQALEVENISRHDEYINFAKEQLDYILGSTGRSYVVGYGVNYPLKPFHAPSTCPNIPEPCNFENLKSPNPNPQILYGALVSGPHENDFYQDWRVEHLYNEVTLDYNSGFQSALAGLIHYLNN